MNELFVYTLQNPDVHTNFSIKARRSVMKETYNWKNKSCLTFILKLQLNV